MVNIPKKINKAIEYILHHLEDDLTVKDIANHCHFSEFYFNRMFKTVTGESVYSFIKRRRLERSAFDISTRTNQSITDIASQYGYSSSNFSSAFKKHYKESPHSFKTTRRERMPKPIRRREYFEKHTRTETIEPIDIVYERYIGTYKDMAHQWQKFIEKHKVFSTENSKFIELSYDDPTITEENRCIYDLGMSYYKNIPEDALTMTIGGGTYKVFRFDDHVSQLMMTFQGLFQIWFLESSIDLDQRKIFLIYRAVDYTTLHMVTDIYIPS